jgi:hypothetical protein
VPLAAMQGELKKLGEAVQDSDRWAWASLLPVPVAALHGRPTPLWAGYGEVSKQLLDQLKGLVEHLALLAELRCIRGLLALEEGDTAAARRHLQSAFEVTGGQFTFPSHRIAARYLQYLKEQAP